MRIPKLKPLDPVYVEALDLTVFNGWQSLDDTVDAQALNVVCCGLYISHNDELLRIAEMSTMEGEEATEILVIPVGCIKKVKKLRVPK